MNRRALILFFTLLYMSNSGSLLAKENFFNQMYRGWLWFEEEENHQENLEQNQPIRPTQAQIDQARSDNELFKKELEDLRHLIIRYPDNLNYIRLYKEKEKEMFEGAMTLASNFAMVNFLNPEIVDQLKSPQNIYGRNVVKLQKEQENQQILRELSKKVELFVFREENCPHCPLLEKHLDSFAKKYGFSVEAISKDSSQSSYFKTYNNPEIINQLALNVMPSVIAVTKDSSQRFELVRGSVSIPDLEDKALLLDEFLKTRLIQEEKIR